MIGQEELDFGGRVAIVTGAGSGLGREHALLLASRGTRVVVHDSSSDDALRTVRQIIKADGIAIAATHDALEDAHALVEAAIDRFDRLDIVVNNIGTVPFGRFWQTDRETWWRMFNTHLRGSVEVTRQAMPHLIVSGTGRLINVTSSALLGVPAASHSCAANAAILGLGNSLACEAREVGVQVSTVQRSGRNASTGAPAVLKVLGEELESRAVAAFVTWLAHEDTPVHGECFLDSGVSAAVAQDDTVMRLRAEDASPEGWANCVGDQCGLMAARQAFTPLRAELAS
ncbi:SDR family NAD(P)-dependent oxidoreductase [Amycolatopsis thermoflava]|uniref:SDR family NAD(P)-dependent oxidoreductase n=1 Tax=Amycolatopsis thermoflava TaxID=84480 RepID=UPI003826A8DA